MLNKREKEVYEGLLDSEAAVLKALKRQYERALQDINNRIRLLQSDELTQSRIYQVDYQKALKKQVEAIIEKLHADEYDTIHKYLADSYTDTYVGTMYSMSGQGVHVITPIDQNAAVKAIITDSKLKATLYDSLGYDMGKLKKHVREEITRGVATALPFAQIARNISNRTSLPLSNAKRIVRTEGHRIQQASADDARKMAISKGANVVKQWNASLDMATRPIHRQLDGQIREDDEPFEAGGYKVMYPGTFGEPSQDCNCRCVALTRAREALDEEELETLKKRAEFFGLDKAESFEDYKKKYLKAAEDESSTDFQEAERIKKSRTFAVDPKVIEGREYADKFSRMTDDKQVRRAYLKAAKEILHHRSGQNGEDLYLFNSKTKTWYRSTTGTEAGTPEYTQTILDAIKKSKAGDLVSFHNHPASMPPSDMDLNAALQNGYGVGYILGHNGTIFEYTAPSRYIRSTIYDLTIADFKEQGYNEYEAQVKTLDALAEEFGFSFKEVK